MTSTIYDGTEPVAWRCPHCNEWFDYREEDCEEFTVAINNGLPHVICQKCKNCMGCLRTTTETSKPSCYYDPDGDFIQAFWKDDACFGVDVGDGMCVYFSQDADVDVVVGVEIMGIRKMVNAAQRQGVPVKPTPPSIVVIREGDIAPRDAPGGEG